MNWIIRFKSAPIWIKITVPLAVTATVAGGVVYGRLGGDLNGARQSAGDSAVQIVSSGSGPVTVNQTVEPRKDPRNALNGTWKGESVYDTQATQGSKFSSGLFVNAEFDGSQFTGKSYETGAIGRLGAVKGSIEGNAVQFTLMYEQVPDYKRHSVKYEGTFDRASERMTGSWHSDTGDSGSFFLQHSLTPFKID